jgi:hypothetical protein
MSTDLSDTMGRRVDRVGLQQLVQSGARNGYNVDYNGNNSSNNVQHASLYSILTDLILFSLSHSALSTHRRLKGDDIAGHPTMQASDRLLERASNETAITRANVDGKLMEHIYRLPYHPAATG